MSTHCSKYFAYHFSLESFKKSLFNERRATSLSGFPTGSILVLHLFVKILFKYINTEFDNTHFCDSMVCFFMYECFCILFLRKRRNVLLQWLVRAHLMLLNFCPIFFPIFIWNSNMTWFFSPIKDPGTALMETKPMQVYTNENRLWIQLSPQVWLYLLSMQIRSNM